METVNILEFYWCQISESTEVWESFLPEDKQKKPYYFTKCAQNNVSGIPLLYILQKKDIIACRISAVVL